MYVSHFPSSDKVYLVPKADRKSLFHQTCKTNIVPGYNCSVPQASSFFGLSPANQNDPQHLCFNVLGSRPVELAVQVLWDSHYPVDLHLAWSSMASASDSLHVRLYVLCMNCAACETLCPVYELCCM